MTESAGNIGPATDRNNAPVEDPTRNVQALNDAGLERQDALRNMESRHFREILTLRSDCAEKVSRLEASLNEEKFAGVKRLQAVAESHRIELKGDGEKALTAALSAAEKAVAEQNKSATLSVDRAVAGMKELIINNAQLNTATTSALTDKVEDIKGQVAILVNQQIGANQQKTEQRTVTQERQAISSGMVALAAFVATLLLGIAGLLIAVLLRG